MKNNFIDFVCDSVPEDEMEVKFYKNQIQFKTNSDGVELKEEKIKQLYDLLGKWLNEH